MYSKKSSIFPECLVVWRSLFGDAFKKRDSGPTAKKFLTKTQDSHQIQIVQPTFPQMFFALVYFRRIEKMYFVKNVSFFPSMLLEMYLCLC